MTKSTSWAELCGLFTGTGANLSLPWERLPVVSSAPVIDVGAGAGFQTVQLADQLSQHEIIAIEPDDAMRIALMTRLTGRPDLGDRVTVYPWSLADMPIDMPIGTALLNNVVYELPDLVQTLGQLAERLVPGAVTIINHMHTTSMSEPVEYRRTGAATMGRLRYERWFARYRDHDGSMKTVNEYTVTDGDQVINSVSEYRVVAELDNGCVADQARKAGFVVDGETVPGYWILTRPSS